MTMEPLLSRARVEDRSLLWPAQNCPFQRRALLQPTASPTPHPPPSLQGKSRTDQRGMPRRGESAPGPGSSRTRASEETTAALSGR